MGKPPPFGRKMSVWLFLP